MAPPLRLFVPVLALLSGACVRALDPVVPELPPVEGTSRVWGEVTSELPLALEGLILELDGEGISAETELDATGGFWFDDVPVGTCTVHLRYPDIRYPGERDGIPWTEYETRASVVIGEATGGREEFDVSTLVPGSISLTVSANGEPVREAVVYACRPAECTGPGDRASTSSEGQARLSHLWPGEWMLIVRASGWSAFVQDVDVTSLEETEVRLDLELWEGRLGVVGEDGEVLANERVVLAGPIWNDDLQLYAGYQWNTTDSDGWISVRMPPGRYRLFRPTEDAGREVRGWTVFDWRGGDQPLVLDPWDPSLRLE